MSAPNSRLALGMKDAWARQGTGHKSEELPNPRLSATELAGGAAGELDPLSPGLLEQG